MLRCLLLLLFVALPAQAQVAPGTATRSHALTILGTPALPADFPYFPYVNPQAPKGGEAVFAMVGSFDGFNPYILRGNAAIGTGASWQPGVGGTAAGSAMCGKPCWSAPQTRSRPATATSPKQSSWPPTACGSPSSCGPRRASPMARLSPPPTSPGPSGL